MSGNPYQPPAESTVDDRDVRQTTRVMSFVATHAIISLCFGSLFVVAVLPLHAAVLLTWLAVLVVAARRQFKAHRTKLGVAVIAIQALVMVAIIATAHLAPVKTTEFVLSRTVTLPKTEMTLPELHELSCENHRESFPIMISLAVPDADNSLIVTSPACEMSLRQFVTAVEDQSPLRHRFAHCGTSVVG